jgi:Chain length determinant protein
MANVPLQDHFRLAGKAADEREPSPSFDVVPRHEARIDLNALIHIAISRWLVIFIGALLGVALSIGYSAMTKPLYVVSVTVGPSQPDSITNFGSQGAASQGSLSSLLWRRSNSAPFDEFRYLLLSHEVAEELATKQGALQVVFGAEWDTKTGQWRHKTSVLGHIREFINGIFGLPGWHAPTAETLQAYLRGSLSIVLDESQIYTISLRYPDPKVGRWLLGLVIHDADSYLRDRDRSIIIKQEAYLNAKSKQATTANMQKVLIDLLSVQESRMMAIGADVPYAFTHLGSVSAGETPVVPKPFLYMFVGAVAGLLLGLGIAVILGSKRGTRPFPGRAAPRREV